MKDLFSIFQLLGLDAKTLFIGTILIILLTITILLLRYFVNHLTKSFQGFETKMNIWGDKMEDHMRETYRKLGVHSKDVEKATKSFEGNVTEMRKNMLGLRQDLFIKIEDTKEFIAATSLETKRVSQALEFTVQNFDEKFGRVIEMRQKIDHAYGRVEVIEGELGSLKIEKTKQAHYLGNIGKVLQSQQAELRDLKKKKRSGEDDGV